jgi:Flp pilus assembly pilin Flp
MKQWSRNHMDYRRRGGLEVVEYAIIVGLIVAATLTAMTILGSWAGAQYEAAGSALASQIGS